MENVNFIRNNQAKRYIIRILPDKCVRVTIPKNGTRKEAEKFLNQNFDKIKKQLNQQDESTFEFNQKYKSKFFNFKIIPSQLENTVEKINRTFVIKINHKLKLQSSEAQEYIEFILKQILRIEAKHYIPKKTMELAHQYQLNVSNIKINSAQTRWGSCSMTNSLNFSLFLIQLPYSLIDYVILHELSHTIHKNHSKAFYELLNRLSSGKHLDLNKQLKHFSPRIKADYFEKV